MKDLHEVLTILLGYRPEGTASARGDSVYMAGPEPSGLRPEHARRLKELGCSYDEEYESWHIFV